MTTIFGVCLYHRVSLVRALIVLTGSMVVLTLFGGVAVTGWLCYLLAVAMLAVPAIRQTIISQKALSLFKKVLPAMSQTEKEALKRVPYGGKLSCSKASLNGRNFRTLLTLSSQKLNKPF